MAAKKFIFGTGNAVKVVSGLSWVDNKFAIGLWYRRPTRGGYDRLVALRRGSGLFPQCRIYADPDAYVPNGTLWDASEVSAAASAGNSSNNNSWHFALIEIDTSVPSMRVTNDFDTGNAGTSSLSGLTFPIAANFQEIWFGRDVEGSYSNDLEVAHMFITNDAISSGEFTTLSTPDGGGTYPNPSTVLGSKIRYYWYDSAVANVGGITLVDDGSPSVTGSLGTTNLPNVADPAGTAYTMPAANGSFSLFGQAVTLTYSGSSPVLTAQNGSFTFTGQSANLLVNRALSVNNGTFLFTGGDALADYQMTATTGSFALNGQAATLTYSPLLSNYTMLAGTGLFNETGQAAGLVNTRTIAAGTGSFSFNGQDATLTTVRVWDPLTAVNGSFAVSGQAVTLTYTPRIDSTYTLTANSGTFTLTGQSAGYLYGYNMLSDNGSFSVSAPLTITRWSGEPKGRKKVLGGGLVN